MYKRKTSHTGYACEQPRSTNKPSHLEWDVRCIYGYQDDNVKQHRVASKQVKDSSQPDSSVPDIGNLGREGQKSIIRKQCCLDQGYINTP
jgi:hypothetical protein